MNSPRKFQLILGLAVLLILVGAQFSPAQAQNSETTITVTKTASGLWKNTIIYGWGLNKSVSPLKIEVGSGQTGTLSYTLNATRFVASQTTTYGVSGEICVTNTGNAPTQNSRFIDRVQYRLPGGDWQEMPGTLTVVYSTREINPGQTACKTIPIQFTPIPGAEYRNVADFVIKNYVGYAGQDYAVTAEAPFSLPLAPTSSIELGASASLNDVLTCPAGFTCTATASGPWSLSASTTINYSVTVQNNSAACGNNFRFENTATLAYTASGPRSVSASAFAKVYTGECPPALQGCTPGYWKYHPEAWVGYSPAQRVDSVFNVPLFWNSLADDTLADALNYRNGTDLTAAGRHLLRAGLTAVLNATHNGINYPRTPEAVIADVNAALASADQSTITALATQLDADNSLGCPLR